MAAQAQEKAETPEASGAGSQANPSSGTPKIVMILTAVNLLGTLGMVAILFLMFQKEKKEAKISDMVVSEEHGGGHGEAAKTEGGHGEAGKEGGAKPKAPELAKMLALEQFTVNLLTPGTVNPKFVRVNVSLEVATDDMEGEVNSKMPQVRNAIIDLFNSKRPVDLATTDGREYLKEEIKNALNSFLVTGKIKGVFFTSFNVSS